MCSAGNSSPHWHGACVCYSCACCSEANTLDVAAVTSQAPPPVLLRRIVNDEAGQPVEVQQAQDLGVQLAPVVLWVLDP